MAPKRPADDSTSSQTASEQTPSPETVSKRPPRIKSFPNRFRHGVDKGIPGVPSSQPSVPSSTSARPRGIVIQEPSENPRRAPIDPEVAKSKGKAKAVEETPKKRREKEVPRRKSDHPSIPAEGQPSGTKPIPKGKRATKKKAVKKAKTSNTPQSSVPQPPQADSEDIGIIPNAVFDIHSYDSPPQGFLSQTATLPDHLLSDYKETFASKEFCPVMSVDLAKLRDDLNCDVYPWLGQFETLISIAATYSAGIVKLFYYNMTSDNLVDSDGELVEERISTHIRGRHIYLTASILNQILLIDNPPPMPEFHYSNERIFQILRPGEEISDEERVRLTFTPAQMPPLYRVVWYIYSRNLLQKGGNYTHFAQKDYPIFAGLIDKRPINVGEWLFKEISRFRFGSRVASHVPFGSLVSVILFYHKIWPIGTNTTEHRVPTPFGQHQLNLMHISFGEGSGQSRAPSRTRRSFSKATRSRVQEAESAPSHLPTDLESKLQEMVDKAIDKLIDRVEMEMTKVLNTVSQEYNDLSDAQTDMAATLGTLMVGHSRLEEKMDRIINLLTPPESKPFHDFGSPFDIPQDPTPPFQFSTPLPLKPLNVSPPTATTEIIPPSHTPAPSVATEKLDSPTGSSATALFEDAKGGEDES